MKIVGGLLFLVFTLFACGRKEQEKKDSKKPVAENVAEQNQDVNEGWDIIKAANVRCDSSGGEGTID